MKPSSLITATLALLVLAISALHAEEPPVTITELFKQDHPELKDKEIVVKRIELQPGVAAPPHVHPGMVTGYVQQGLFEFQIKGGPLLKLKAGDVFFEPAGSVHVVGKNPGTEKTVLIAFVENPKGAPLSTPLEEHGK
jgi:quercetin dioxygenase-like cupin family protein